MAGNRGKGDPMAGLLSGLGGIDPNLFNKPTMGQLKNKQQSPAVPAKPASPAPRSDTIAAVGSPSRPNAATDSFSSQKSTNARANPERSGRQHRLSKQTAAVTLHPSRSSLPRTFLPPILCNREAGARRCTRQAFSMVVSSHRNRGR